VETAWVAISASDGLAGAGRGDQHAEVVPREGIVRGLLLRVQLSVGPKGVGLPGPAAGHPGGVCGGSVRR
jgi:hypothetical protein